MFTGNVLITGGTFVNTSTTRSFEILHGKIAPDAFHDSGGANFDRQKCHPKTRVAVLAEIMQWIKAMEESEDILWLYGSAGAGKSAIAQSIAEMCAELGLMIANFFFSRASQLRHNDKRLISTIAYQLAISIPATRSYIESAVHIDPAIFDRSLETQIKTLIIGPLKNAYADVNPAIVKQWPRLIIIDGLDECDDPLIQCSIIRLLSKALRCAPVRLILFVASRPEPHIRNTFNRLIKSESRVSRPIVLDNSYKPDADIKEFLTSRFNDIKENYHLAIHIPESWPSEEIVDRLVRKSSGQFIYASTVMKYLDSPKHRLGPVKRLDVIMGLRPVDGDMPYKELDALYSHIFSCVEDLAITLKILGFLFFGLRFVVFNPSFLACLLAIDKEDVDLRLSELHSILYIHSSSGRRVSEIEPTHASLQDFLVDKLRSGRFFLDEEAFHMELAQQSIRQIHKLSAGMNEASEKWSDLDRYLMLGFIHHCTSIHAPTDFAILKNDLMQLCDLRPMLDEAFPFCLTSVPYLYEWLHKADTAGKELSSHFQSLWDQYLHTKLSEYPCNGNVDIAGLLFLPRQWKRSWFYVVSGSSQVPLIWDYSDDECRDFLCKFFEDKTRSGKYYVDGTVCAHAALECLRNMVNPNDDEIFNPYPFVVLGIARPNAKLFMSITEDITSQREILVPGYSQGLEAVTLLLAKASPLTDLYFYLRDHPLQNPAKAKVHCEHGFASLRLAVKVYLEKCKHLVPKVLRRSASCPFNHPYVDLKLDTKLDTGKGPVTMTFNQRWPLARDRSGQWSSIKYDALADMRGLPEMAALQSQS